MTKVEKEEGGRVIESMGQVEWQWCVCMGCIAPLTHPAQHGRAVGGYDPSSAADTGEHTGHRRAHA